MNVEEYLKDRLENCTKYDLTDLDKKILDTEGIEEYIYKKLTSKKFRKWKVGDLIENQYKTGVKSAMSQNAPLQLVFPFGGYKLWRLPSEPEVDWAEFFTMAYYSSYVAPILAIYKPGVNIIFSSDEVVVERMDNIGNEQTEQYFKSFDALADVFGRVAPSNIKIMIKKVRDLYESNNQLEAELQEKMTIGNQKFEKMIEAAQKKELITSELNIKWDGAKDWTLFSEEQKKEKIKQSVIVHEAYRELSKRKELLRGKDSILIFTTPIANALALGTTRASIAKFWAGMGVLARDGESYAEYVITPKQWETIKNQPHETIASDLIPLKNFKEILVYPEKFNFSL